MDPDDVLAGLYATKKKPPHKHTWRGPTPAMMEDGDDRRWCDGCLKRMDLTRARTARNNRTRGKTAEREAAVLFGGEVVGGLNGPDDLRGQAWVSQVKSHMGQPPAWLRQSVAVRVSHPQHGQWAWVWTTYPSVGHLAQAPERWSGIFAAMAARPKHHRLLERYAQRGKRAAWFVVVNRGDLDDLQIPPVRMATYVVLTADDWVGNFGTD